MFITALDGCFPTFERSGDANPKRTGYVRQYAKIDTNDWTVTYEEFAYPNNPYNGTNGCVDSPPGEPARYNKTLHVEKLLYDNDPATFAGPVCVPTPCERAPCGAKSSLAAGYSLVQFLQNAR